MKEKKHDKEYYEERTTDFVLAQVEYIEQLKEEERKYDYEALQSQGEQHSGLCKIHISGSVIRCDYGDYD